jgi:hypothetical protein
LFVVVDAKSAADPFDRELAVVIIDAPFAPVTVRPSGPLSVNVVLPLAPSMCSSKETEEKY